MMQIFDFLPTLLKAAGYDMTNLPLNLDGIDQWDVLSANRDAIRTEMLHNIDNQEKTRALRVEDMKIVVSGGGSTKSWPYWYSTDQFFGGYNLTDHSVKNNLSGLWPRDSTNAAPVRSDLEDILATLGRSGNKGGPLVVECGAVPPTAKTSCNVGVKPCLFNITADPCEFNNLADHHPDMLSILLERLESYQSTAVEPRNKPIDPNGFPSKHGGIWEPWIKL